MEIQTIRAEKIEEAINRGYQSVCKEYREKYRQAVEAYNGPHKTPEDFEKAIETASALAQEIPGSSDSCINNVDIGLMVLYHDLMSRYKERKIREKRKEMKNWPFPFIETEVQKALKFLAEAQQRKKASEEMVDYYIRDGSV